MGIRSIEREFSSKESKLTHQPTSASANSCRAVLFPLLQTPD